MKVICKIILGLEFLGLMLLYAIGRIIGLCIKFAMFAYEKYNDFMIVRNK